MENLINKLKENKPNKILVTGGNKIHINKFSKDIADTMANFFNLEYKVINDESLNSQELVEVNNEIKKYDHCVISGSDLVHFSDILNVDFIIFIENNPDNANRNKERDKKHKDDILERAIQIHNESQILNPPDFMLEDSYKVKLRFFEYWVVPQLLFNPTKNTYLIKESSIVVV